MAPIITDESELLFDLDVLERVRGSLYELMDRARVIKDDAPPAKRAAQRRREMRQF